MAYQYPGYVQPVYAPAPVYAAPPQQVIYQPPQQQQYQQPPFQQQQQQQPQQQQQQQQRSSGGCWSCLKTCGSMAFCLVLSCSCCNAIAGLLGSGAEATSGEGSDADHNDDDGGQEEQH